MYYIYYRYEVIYTFQCFQGMESFWDPILHKLWGRGSEGIFMYHTTQSNIFFIIPTNIQHQLYINGQDDSRNVLVNYRIVKDYRMPVLMKYFCWYNKKIWSKCTERRTLKPCRAICNQSNLWDGESKHVFHSREGGKQYTHLLDHLSVDLQRLPAFTSIMSKEYVGTRGCRWHHGSEWQFDSVKYQP